MKEIRFTPNMPELTGNSNPPTLDVRGNIFMPEPGNGEIPKDIGRKPTSPKEELQSKQPQKTEPVREEGRIFTPAQQDTQSLQQEYEGLARFLAQQKRGHQTEDFATEVQPRLVEIGEELRKRGVDVAEISTKAREGTDTAHGPGSPAATKVSIFEGLPEIQESLTDDERRKLQEAGNNEDQIKNYELQRKVLIRYIDAFKRSETSELLDPMEAHNQLNQAAIEGAVSITDAEEYLTAIGKSALQSMKERLTRPGPKEIKAIEDILETTTSGSSERREGLIKWIGTINPDNVTIDTEYQRVIAEDEETAEMLLDKIISKPFSAPEDGYRLSFYAEINLAGFLTEVNAIDRQRHTEYVRKKETSLRFHEMNRTIISESGNPDAFLSISRSVTPRHLQTATEIAGVERVRQLIDSNYGRLYANTNRLKEGDFEPEILNRATKQFYKEAGYQWNEDQRKWIYQGGEKIKSNFLDNDGNPKHLEDWEIQRAIAFGRNIHSAFYRHSELISWSALPKNWEEWLKSMPSETVVRTFSGLKALAYRFRMGGAGGGPWFTRLIYDKIQKKEYKTNLKKIGKLDIKEDLIPTGFFKGGGFDKGWRTLIAYLDTNVAKITIPSPDMFPEAVRGSVRKFIEDSGSNETTLYNFLINQEYLAQLATAIRAEVAGVEMPEELLYFDYGEQAKLVEQVLIPIMDQINLSLGVLISFGASSDGVKKALWEKTADFLPLRVGYALSEEGVRNLPGYEHVKGEGERFFNDGFEEKLLTAQHLRFTEQKKAGNTKITLDDSFLKEAGLGKGEIDFVKELQKFGRENAEELAKAYFPHIPFLDDVPFGSANYIDLGAEVFPRRVGGDFRAYLETNNAYNAIPGNLAMSYEEFLKSLRQIEDSLTSPEGPVIAQNVGFPILQTYFEFAKQWGWTRWPLVKPIRELMGKPTSEFQKFFGSKKPSWGPTAINTNANEALSQGVLRREKLPGEERSQMDELLRYMSGTWTDVLKEQTPKAGLFFLVTMLMEFFKQIRESK